MGTLRPRNYEKHPPPIHILAIVIATLREATMMASLIDEDHQGLNAQAWEWIQQRIGEEHHRD